MERRAGLKELKKLVVVLRAPSQPAVYDPPAHGICWFTVKTLLNSLLMTCVSTPSRKVADGITALSRSMSNDRLGSQTERASATAMSWICGP